jgi:hypothetical protein
MNPDIKKRSPIISVPEMMGLFVKISKEKGNGFVNNFFEY